MIASIVTKTFIAIIFALQIAGCTNIERLKPDTGEGTKAAIYRHSYDEVWNAANDVAGRKYILIESNKSTGTIRAEAKESTFGEVAGIFISPSSAGSKRYIVEVLILYKYRPVTPDQTSESEFINELKAELGL